MSNTNLEEIILDAAESNDKTLLEKIIEEIKSITSDPGSNIYDALNLLLESWEQNEKITGEKTQFILSLAKLYPLKSEIFKHYFATAVKETLPPKYRKTQVLNFLGFKNHELDFSEILLRTEKLNRLEKGALVMLTDSKRWCEVEYIDIMSQIVFLVPLTTKTSIEVPLENIIKDHYAFENSNEIRELLEGIVCGKIRNEIPPSEIVRGIFHDALKYDISESVFKEIIYNTFIGKIFSDINSFSAWWDALPEAIQEEKKETRRFSEARSLKELHIIIFSENFRIPENVSESDKWKIKDLLCGIKCENLNQSILAEVIAKLFNIFKNQIKEIFINERLYISLWPDEDNLSPRTIEYWGNIRSLCISDFYKVSKIIKGDYYIYSLASLLPIKCLSVIMADHENDIKHIFNAAFSKNPSSSVLLWIWRNRKSYSYYLKFFSMLTILSSLRVEQLPKAWQASAKDLKKLLLGSSDLHELILKNEKNNFENIMIAIQRTDVLSSQDCQSLLVKLSRHSDEFRKFLEEGAAKHVMDSSLRETQGEDEIKITSIYSYNEKLRELDNIIKKEIPENRAAIAHARSYGDLRENSEYTEALRRKDFLLQRRAELERDLKEVQVVDFSKTKVIDIVVPGSTVKLKNNAREKVYYIGGIWDGDPDNNIIAYNTKLGKCLLNKRLGETVKMPDNMEWIIESVSPLPNSLLEKLKRTDKKQI